MPVYTKDDIKVLHIHTPKTGGESIEQLFLNNNFKMDLYGRSPSTMYVTETGSKIPLQHLHGELLLEKVNLNEINYSFMIYRDPVKRIISDYKFMMHHFETHCKLNADDWIIKTLNEYKKDNSIKHNHIRPQHEFYIDGCDVYDFKSIGNMGRILSESIKGLTNISTPHNNRSFRRVTINESTINCVKDFYRKDYEWFESLNTKEV